MLEQNEVSEQQNRLLRVVIDVNPGIEAYPKRHFLLSKVESAFLLLRFTPTRQLSPGRVPDAKAVQAVISRPSDRCQGCAGSYLPAGAAGSSGQGLSSLRPRITA